MTSFISVLQKKIFRFPSLKSAKKYTIFDRSYFMFSGCDFAKLCNEVKQRRKDRD